MDLIRVGLDFGTHQTKICIKRTPDEGHGEPIFEFFPFYNTSGIKSYMLPSIVQLNSDDTLSYGFVDGRREKAKEHKPIFEVDESGIEDFDIQAVADSLYEKYNIEKSDDSNRSVLLELLNVRKEKLSEIRKKRFLEATNVHKEKLAIYNEKRNVYRYFKQATFADRIWNRKIDNVILSIWYLSYVIFLLEEKYDQNFSINMGIPASFNSYEQMKKKAVSILASAYHLVEDIYSNDMQKFLNEKIEILLEKTEIISYSDEVKHEYKINIFPEAYAGLISLTSKGKIASGMSLTADIGGGTTDVSFFTIQEGKPIIYRYWSIPRGLNYIAEKSGYDYSDFNFHKDSDVEIIKEFNDLKKSLVHELKQELENKLKQETSISISRLHDALRNRVLVYTGGGSIYDELTVSMNDFSDVKTIDTSMWAEENVSDKPTISKLCQILSTAYGLSIGQVDSEIILGDFSTLFASFPKDRTSKRPRIFVDKDMC